jgi:hypothetical protein
MLLPGDNALDIGLLLLGAVVRKRRDDREVADDRGFVLQVVVQPKPLGGEVFADRRDGEIGGGLATAGFGQTVTQVTGFVGAALHFADQCAPFVARTSVIVPVGPRILAAMIEELDIIALEWLDLGLDEGVQFGELVGDFPRQVEVHGASPGALFLLKIVL